MRRLTLSFLIASLLLGIASAISHAAPVAQNELPDLVPTGLAWQPQPAVTGQPIRFTVTLANQGNADVPAEIAPSVTLTLVAQPEGSDRSAEPCVEEAAGLAGLGAGGSREYSFTCTYTPSMTGDYSFTVAVDPKNAIQEANEDNNSLADVALTVGEPPSALPEGISRLFAGLGLFAAVMAILAAGTEVAIDTLRLFFGLKRKPTSLEALDKLKDMLPGKLEALGAGAEAEQQIKTYVSSLKEILAPVQQAQDLYLKAQSGEVGEAVQGVIEWAARARPDLAKELPKEIDNRIGVAVEKLQSQLGFSQDLAQTLKQGAQIAVSRLTDKSNVASALSEVVRYLQSEAPALTADWLRAQADTLVKQGPGYALQRFDADAAPELRGMGMGEGDIAHIRQSLEHTLGELEAKSLLGVKSYTDALQALMQAVENRRYETQSPLRKVWRRLREMKIVGGAIKWLDGIFALIVGREKGLSNPETVPGLTASNAAEYLMSRNDKQQDEEASRLRWLRLLSAVMGILLAYSLSIDAAVLLDKAVPGVANNINAVRIPAGTLRQWLNPGWLMWLLRRAADQPLIPVVRDLTAGIILSGFAASAGSAFWHDQLDRLQAAKKSAESVAQLAQSAKKLAGGAE